MRVCVYLVFPILWGPNLPTRIVVMFFGPHEEAYESNRIKFFENLKCRKFCDVCVGEVLGDREYSLYSIKIIMTMECQKNMETQRVGVYKCSGLSI